MRPSDSSFLDIRGLRYHVRRWPRPGARKLILLHGWMDVSASFQFLVDELRGEWDVHAPDWRGYGLTDWAKADCYWFPDYLADLDFILEEIHADEPVILVGHSLGGNAAALYAGIRPARVARLVNLEGFGLPQTRPEQAPVLWVEGAESGTARRMKLAPEELAQRRAAFRDVRHATVPDAGHMLHHDQPQAVAALIEEFLA